MDTEFKLGEAKFFFEKLEACNKDEDEYVYYFTAFLNSLKGIWDVMLYDFVRDYIPGLGKGDKIKNDDILLAGKILERERITRFANWRRREEGKLSSKNPLWSLRNIAVHRGLLDKIVYVYVTGPETADPYEIFHSPYGFGGYSRMPFEEEWPEETVIYYDGGYNMPERVIEDCKNTLNKMIKLIVEAEKEFGLKL